MTRFAKSGQSKKRPLDATSWQDLKGKSKQETEPTESKETLTKCIDNDSTTVLKGVEKTTTFKHCGNRSMSKNSPKKFRLKEQKKQRFDKRKHFSEADKRKGGFECYNCKGMGHKASECPEPSDGKNDAIVCHACKGLGHKAFRCPNSQGSGKNRKGLGKFHWQNKPVKEVWNKEKRREWRRQKREKERETKKHCFNCREAGHQVSDCPELQKDVEQGTGICFKCGSTEHTIHQCNIKLPKDKFPFAKCFICGETGHLSKQCPDNPRGLYPDGGCCNQCGSVEHLKRDCPEVQSKQGIGDMTLGRLDKDTTGDVEDVPIQKERKKNKQTGPKLVKF